MFTFRLFFSIFGFLVLIFRCFVQGFGFLALGNGFSGFCFCVIASILSFIKIEAQFSIPLNIAGVAMFSPMEAAHGIWMVHIYSV